MLVREPAVAGMFYPDDPGICMKSQRLQKSTHWIPWIAGTKVLLAGIEKI